MQGIVLAGGAAEGFIDHVVRTSGYGDYLVELLDSGTGPAAPPRERD